MTLTIGNMMESKTQQIDEWIKKHESEIQDILPLKKIVKQLEESNEYDFERFLEVVDNIEWLKEDLKSLRISIALLYDVMRQLQKEIEKIKEKI